MLGLIYYIMCILTGFTVICLLFPNMLRFNEKTYSGKSLNLSSIFMVLPVSVVTGTLLMVWPTYILACVFGGTGKPLSYANMIVMPLAIVFVALGMFYCLTKKRRGFDGLKKGLEYKDIILTLFVLILASFLMFLTFYVKDGKLAVGFSVFSDFAPHLGMIRSFSFGDNFPTGYSHFAGEDIKYHFLFQFLVGNLEYLGLRIDLAFNIPSILCFVSACMLLYTLAVKLFGKKSVGMLAVLFFLFRSGSALTSYIAGINGEFKDVIDALKNNTAFIGETLHEDWGLWNLNVYVNQRHLAFGLTIALAVILLMLQPVFEGCKRVGTAVKSASCEKGEIPAVIIPTFINKLAFTKESWLIKDLKTAVFCGLLLGLGAFFNGACVIACLLVLLFLAFITDRRLEYLLVAVIAVGFSFLESGFFIDGSVMEFRWEPGFLAEVKTFFGTLDYLNTLLGIMPIVLVAAFLMVNGWYKWILFAFLTPLIFAVTFQMTTDTAVNHKYIMFACMLLSVFLGAYIYKLYNKRGLMVKLVAIILTILLTCTGVYDLSVVIKKNSPANSGALIFSLNDPITMWIAENSDASDIYLTDYYSLNNVVLGGAMLYYGWPYYAWSAGYDTGYREKQVKLMYEASSSEVLEKLINEHGIDFIIVDQAARSNGGYEVREDVIAATYECVYTEGDGDWKFSIYDTKLLK